MFLPDINKQELTKENLERLNLLLYNDVNNEYFENDKILNEIDCLLFNTGVVSGEYGIANSFSDKSLFFKSLKPKNKKVEKFVNKLKVLKYYIKLKKIEKIRV